MGFFSWKTQDTNKSITNVHSETGSFPVYMHDDKGNVYLEMEYDGYGVFGGVDYYVLLAQMNGLEDRGARQYHSHLTMRPKTSSSTQLDRDQGLAVEGRRARELSQSRILHGARRRGQRRTR